VALIVQNLFCLLFLYSQLTFSLWNSISLKLCILFNFRFVLKCKENDKYFFLGIFLVFRYNVSMDAVGASVPQFLKVEVLAPRDIGNFSNISINSHKNDKKKLSNLVISWQKLTSSTHWLKLLMAALVFNFQLAHFLRMIII